MALYLLVVSWSWCNVDRNIVTSIYISCAQWYNEIKWFEKYWKQNDSPKLQTFTTNDPFQIEVCYLNRWRNNGYSITFYIYSLRMSVSIKQSTKKIRKFRFACTCPGCRNQWTCQVTAITIKLMNQSTVESKYKHSLLSASRRQCVLRSFDPPPTEKSRWKSYIDWITHDLIGDNVIYNLYFIACIHFSESFIV